jgi:hypothetical protein
MIESPFDRLPENEKAIAREVVAKVDKKVSFLMSEVSELWRIWHYYKLGPRQNVGCAACYRHVVSKFKHWTNNG